MTTLESLLLEQNRIVSRYWHKKHAVTAFHIGLMALCAYAYTTIIMRAIYGV